MNKVLKLLGKSYYNVLLLMMFLKNKWEKISYLNAKETSKIKKHHHNLNFIH